MIIGNKEIKLSELEQRADEIYLDYVNNIRFYTTSETEKRISKECDSIINSAFSEITEEQSEAIVHTKAVNEELGFIKGYIHAMRNMLKVD
ncbi:MAG: hypothetical protein PUG48_11335 [Clostridia bacterium]|nr:hypothetical protein [Clostridia bacterium]